MIEHPCVIRGSLPQDLCGEALDYRRYTKYADSQDRVFLVLRDEMPVIVCECFPSFQSCAHRLQRLAAAAEGLHLTNYITYHLDCDGCAICDKCFEKTFEQLLHDTVHNLSGAYEGADINYEDNILFCDVCSTRIPPSYGLDNDEDEELQDLCERLRSVRMSSTELDQLRALVLRLE